MPGSQSQFHVTTYQRASPSRCSLSALYAAFTAGVADSRGSRGWRFKLHVRRARCERCRVCTSRVPASLPADKIVAQRLDVIYSLHVELQGVHGSDEA